MIKIREMHRQQSSSCTLLLSLVSEWGKRYLLLTHSLSSLSPITIFKVHYVYFFRKNGKRVRSTNKNSVALSLLISNIFSIIDPSKKTYERCDCDDHGGSSALLE